MRLIWNPLQSGLQPDLGCETRPQVVMVCQANDRERATSFVEMAILLPFFMLLILGTVDIGRGFSTYIGLTTAAREGARWLTINPEDANGAYGRIYQEAGRVGLGGEELTIRILPHKTRYDSGDEVTVNIRYDHRMLFGFVPDTTRIPFNIRVTMIVMYD